MAKPFHVFPTDKPWQIRFRASFGKDLREALKAYPGVTWAEGCFGSFLLSDDVVKKGLRFGYAGRPPKLHDPGLGIAVDSARLGSRCAHHPFVINL